MEIIFFTSIAILIYTYIGYGVLTKLITLFLPKQKLPELQDEDYPRLTHIIAAFNEESIIADKIRNCAFLDYPKDKVRTIIVTDGSSDNTAAIVCNDPRVEHFHQPERNGKLAAVNRVIEAIQTDIIVFSDANTELNQSALKNLTKHFQNNRVGAVAGEKKVISSQNDDASASGEGIYWKYESWLKKIDYKLHSVVGAAGELFAVRYHLYKAPDSNLLIEDFITSMQIAKKGYRIAYAPDAVASEHSSISIDEESKRKIRISAGGLQAVYHLREMLNPFKYGVLTFQYFSHRVLRWTAAPLALMFAFITNALLVGQSDFYLFFMFAQVSFYLLAMVGYVLQTKKIKLKIAFVPFYFSFMNLSVYLGAIRLLNGNYSVIWDKAERK